MSRTRILVLAISCALAASACSGLGRAQEVSISPSPLPAGMLQLAGVSFPEALLPGEREPAAEIGIPLGIKRALFARPNLRLNGSGRSGAVRLIVSVDDRTLAATVGRDTVFYVPAGVATGLTLTYGGQSWRFRTPRGGRRVLKKVAEPVWTPPDWHYAEVALENRLKLARIPASGAKLRNGSRLVIRDSLVGVIQPGEGFAQLPIDEHVVFDDRLFIPPVGTANRRLFGELGSFALDLGGGYMIHGTPDQTSVGERSTHGCIRLRDEDLVWLYDNIPVGTAVLIH